MKTVKYLAVLAVLALLPAAALKKDAPPPKPSSAAALKLADLAPEGKRNMLPGGGWFTWAFASKPKLGTVIVRVQLYDKAGGRTRDLEFIGESGMPSMPYHDSGPVKFQLNKKGDYLLPVDVVMPGEWQLTIRARKEKREIYAAKVLFTI